MNVLAIGAHGDDLEMFCGGTMARYAANSDKVFMCVVTDGRGRPKGELEQVIAIRKAEAQASANVIGAELVWMAIADGGLTDDEPTRHQFIEVIRQSKPDVIITHPPDDYHPDHKTTSRIVMDAAQVARTANYPSALPPHRATVPLAFMDAERGIDFLPEEYVDITSVWDKKIEMLAQHVSQMMPTEEPYDANYRIPNMHETMFYRYVDVMSGFRGLACNVMYAEGFRWWRAANRIVPHRVLP